MSFRSRASALAIASALVIASACNDNGTDPENVIPPGDADITQDITTNRTLYAETTYTLKGFIHVANGATLTIQPGTRILGDYNTLGSSLFILRGSRIVAVGTESQPIVFTSSRQVGSRQPGDWGGLIIVGNGIINRQVSTGIGVEGTGTVSGTASGTNYRVTYDGGTSNTDNSGELKYVRVEFAGFAPASGEELNTFTFAGVGSGTRLSYLQALAGLDDSFEWFGGAVDASHLVSYESGDDHFDMSEGYVGRLQYLIGLQTTTIPGRSGAVGAASVDPQGIENDGCNGTGCVAAFNSTPLTVPAVANFTLIGTGNTATSGTGGGYGIVLRRGTGGYYVNGVVARWPRAGIGVRDSDTYARAGSSANPDMTTTDLAVKNILFVENAAMFQTGTGTNSFDATANSLVDGGATTTTSLFTAFPASVTAATTEAAFDWTPASGSAAASGGMATFSGKLSTKATGAFASGNTLTGTSYRGAAAPGGPKWWQNWTRYAQN